MYASNEIPFLDLVTPHVELEEELTAVFRRALFTAGFVGGPMVEEFELAFAAFCVSGLAVTVALAADPVTLITASLVILLVALTASWVPALRAAQVDPATALRAE